MADRSGHWINEGKRVAIYEINGHVCAYCAKKCVLNGKRSNPRGITLDHVMARELGGNNAATNLVVACRACNAAKGKLNLQGFLAYLAARNVNVNLVAKRIRTQLANGQDIEGRYGRKAGKPQFRKVV